MVYELSANTTGSECTSDLDLSSIHQVDQDDNFKINVSNITPNDIVSIRLQVPADVGVPDFI
jgi:hypothetical protein